MKILAILARFLRGPDDPPPAPAGMVSVIRAGRVLSQGCGR